MTESDTLKKALYTIKKLKQLVIDNQAQAVRPVAIIGVGCRFPKACNKEEFWKLISTGKNTISHLSDARWALLKGTQEATRKDLTQAYWGSHLADIDLFDAYFFGISPREAMRMDPQQRLLLEVAYEAFEDAGLAVETLAGSNTGVFTSLYASPFAHMQNQDVEMDALYIPTGNAVSMAANRLSYLFDLQGPSIVFDTACSSSLVALHVACLNIQAQLCEQAVVGAAHINLLPSTNVLLSKAKMLSPEGQCKTFDASADGYVQGEGAGVVILKSLDKALRDKDRIYGVITGSAINQDGKTNGLTAPNGLQQEALLKSAYQTAKVDAKQVSYIECHGTGTYLGDPIEIQALGEVVSKHRTQETPCWIGSVKTNLGHLEPAAGMASIIKVALALKHSQIPPHLHFNTPNPFIDFGKYHFEVPRKLEPWPKYGEYRFSGVSGFGFGGTNAHIVIRDLSENEDKMLEPTYTGLREQIFTVSAKDPVALNKLVDLWCDYLKSNLSMNVAQLCYNVQVRRSHYFYRIAIIADSTQDLYEKILLIKRCGLENHVDSNHIFINIQKNKLDFSISVSERQLEALAISYVNREGVNWKTYQAASIYPHLDMPCYPWQPKSYWPEFSKAHRETQAALVNLYPFTHKKVSSPLPSLQFEFYVDVNTMPEIADTFNFLHAGYYLEMLAIVMGQLFQQDSFTVINCVFSSPIFVPNDAVVTVQLILERQKNDNYSFTFYSHTQGQEWTPHAAGIVALHVDAEPAPALSTVKESQLASGTGETFRERVLAMGMPSGGSIAWTQYYWLNERAILCELETPPSAQKSASFKLNIHPGIVDASVQSLFMLLPDHLIKPYVASSIGKFTFYGVKNKPQHLVASMKQIAATGEQYTGAFTLLDSQGDVIAHCDDLGMTQLNETIQLGWVAKREQKVLPLSSLSTLERKHKIIQFLIEQTAIIFSMPEKDINVDQSLRDMGIDSLMAIVLASSIETTLAATYSMQDLLKGPTLVDIASAIAGESTSFQSDEINQPRGSWIAYRETKENAKFRLFCFPYGGGGASMYSNWHRDLPDSIEVCPIQLPGRENRIGEDPMSNLHTIVDALCEFLPTEFNLPFAFFGHSFGSLIAFELARALRKRNLPQPLHLFASAFPDPRVPTKSLNNLISQLQTLSINLFDLAQSTSIARLSDETLSNLTSIFNENGLVEYGSHMMNKGIIKELLPTFIGDMSIVKSYQYLEEAPLDVPITVFLGTRDTWVSRDDHLGWTAHSQHKCEFHEFDSGHLFLKESRIKQEMLQKILSSFS